jgi:sugar lactone lactonase YvrE
MSSLGRTSASKALLSCGILIVASMTLVACDDTGSSSGNSFSGTSGSGSGGTSGPPGLSPPSSSQAFAPAITVEPQNAAVLLGGPATFAVTASGTAPLAYQWSRNGVSISGATSATYTTASSLVSDDGSQYAVTVTNGVGATTSANATLSVLQKPSIVTQPAAQAVALGGTATFSVTAAGTAPLTYQWFKNGVAIAGATASSYSVAAAALADSRTIYTVSVSNITNFPLTSQPAMLNVLHTLALISGQLGGIGHADGTGSAATFYTPVATATDSSGNVYVIDQVNQLIRKVTSAGVVTTLAGILGVNGSADGACANATFNNPSGIATDPAGNLYIADTDNDTIRKITLPACTVSTLAGTAGVQGAVDGTGPAAQFARPQGLTVDTGGNVYVADTDSDLIRKVTPAGVVTTLAGSDSVAGSADGTGTAALFNLPVAIAVDSTSGTLYVSDFLNSTIRRITSVGVVTTIAGTAGTFGSSDGTGAAASFAGPWGLALDAAAANLYIADPYNWTIRKLVIATAAVTTVAGHNGIAGAADGTGMAAQFANPVAISADGANNLFVADSDNNTIRKITIPGAVVTTFVGSIGGRGYVNGTGSAAHFSDPHIVVSDSLGNLFVADRGNSVIRKIAVDGSVTTFAGTPGTAGSADGPANTAQFNQPSGIVFDSHGNLFVADAVNNTIRMITPAGQVSTFAGTAGVSGAADGTGAAAQFNSPYGLTIDAADTLYLTDFGNNTIRKITTPGAIVTTLAGTAGVTGSADGTGAAAQFNGPYGLAVNPTTGNIYVADRFNQTIRMVTAAGVVSTIAGTPGQTDYADGTGAAAHFNWPASIAVDGATGNLYVADYLHNEIRKIDAGNNVTTLVGIPGIGPVALGSLPGVLTGPSSVAIIAGTPALQLAITDSVENAVLVATLP